MKKSGDIETKMDQETLSHLERDRSRRYCR